MAIQTAPDFPGVEAAGLPVETTNDDDTSSPLRKSLMKVCVVGAGPSGLTALKALLDRGLSAECFEQADRIGGLWALHVRIGDGGLGKTRKRASLVSLASMRR